MTKYQCPECRGGFPEFTKWQGNLVCPWCYHPFLKHHNSPEREQSRMENTA